MKYIKERILYLLSENALTVNRASSVLDIPQRTLNRQLNEDGNVSTELLRAIQRCFPDVSIEWVLSGQGEMYKNREIESGEVAPYYDSLPLSAGLRDVVDGGCETPSGYISIPNVRAEFFFPVTGTSMQPEINSGDIVGVNSIDSLVAIDSEKTYMIVTREGRMIKHCAACVDDDELLLCSSPNYPDFTLRKEEILRMYEVVVKISSV